MAHTPAPWAYDHKSGDVFIDDRDRDDIRACIAVVDLCNTDADTQGRADGHLIAAAPDLLAALRIARDHVQVALEAAIEEMDEGGHPAEWRAEAEATAKTLQDHVHQIDAAIAKAEGA